MQASYFLSPMVVITKWCPTKLIKPCFLYFFAIVTEKCGGDGERDVCLQKYMYTFTANEMV